MRLGTTVLGFAVAGALGLAQIKSLTLREIVDESDGAVYGQIVSSVVSKKVDAQHGELYFTTITIEGQRLTDGATTSVPVTFYGGFLNEEEGCWNSEAPAAEEVKVGNQIVAFYRWTDDMGGGMAANALYMAHGGLYRTLEGPSGAMVLGRGEGYAIDKNVRLTSLDTAVRKLHQEKLERKQEERR
jgi:hypothetical protein